MNAIMEIMSGTPWWVWPMLGIVLVRGFLATNPIKAADYLFIELGLSGFLSGFFLGKALCFAKRFYKGIDSIKKAPKGLN